MPLKVKTRIAHNGRVIPVGTEIAPGGARDKNDTRHVLPKEILSSLIEEGVIVEESASAVPPPPVISPPESAGEKK